jgi:hypothetical protein
MEEKYLLTIHDNSGTEVFSIKADGTIKYLHDGELQAVTNDRELGIALGVACVALYIRQDPPMPIVEDVKLLLQETLDNLDKILYPWPLALYNEEMDIKPEDCIHKIPIEGVPS